MNAARRCAQTGSRDARSSSPTCCGSCREGRDAHGGGAGCRSASRNGQPLVWGIPAQWRVRHREGKARAARWCSAYADGGRSAARAGLDCEQMPRSDTIALRTVDGAGGAGADPQEIWQEPRPVDDAALFEAVGFFRAETFDASDTARSAKDRDLA